MECPHLAVNEGKKFCKKMKEAGTDGEVSDFDIQHYCQGNPVNCYYFRTLDKHATKLSLASLRQRLR